MQKSVLGIIIGEARQAGIEDICVVVCPGDEAAYRTAAGEQAAGVYFVAQEEPRGYGHALWCARDFVGTEPFLHMIGDHVYVSQYRCCAHQLVEVAQAQDCAVSGVQATRENLLPYFGAIGGQRVVGTQDLYTVERVLEKPTPTEAEQTLVVPGLRAGHYLCFFGMHVLTPAVMELLAEDLAGNDGRKVHLTTALARLAGRERYLGCELSGRRYDIGVKYGLLAAQMALALDGQDRDEVLTTLLELLARREQKYVAPGRA